MALDDGTIYAADGRGACARITGEGKVSFFGSLGGAPNGICIDARGNCIVANIGNGEVQSLSPDGRHRVLMTEAGGKRMGAPNFPFVDSRERLWVTNSTELPDLNQALQRAVPDGAIVLIESGKPRIVAEGLFFANGLTLDAAEQFGYVAESTKRRVSRFKVGEDGSLSDPEVYGPAVLARLGFPDGIAFDEAGNLWITFPAWNAIGYLTPERELKMYLEDPDGKVFRRPSNICFGWKDRRTAFIGSLDGSSIPYFAVPHPGMKLIHQK